MKVYFSAEMPDWLVPDFLQALRDFDTKHDPKHKGTVHIESLMETEWPTERAEAIFKGIRPAFSTLVKENVGRMGHTLGYSIDGQGRFSWTGESASAVSGDRKLANANQWLAELLRSGSREQREIRQAAEAADISYATLRRAKTVLRVRSYKAEMSGPWMWALPEGAHDPTEGCSKIAKRP